MGKIDIVRSLIREIPIYSSFITKPVKSTVEIVSFKPMNALKQDAANFSSLRKIFSREQALNMKPKEFQTLLKSRLDISPNVKENLTSPEKLHLYDEITSLSEIKNLTLDEKSKFLEQLFKDWNINCAEISAQLEVLPALLKKGYNPEFLAQLPITNANKNQIEYILERSDLPQKALNKRIENLAANWRYGEATLKSNIEFMKGNFNSQKEIKEILKYVNDKNVKYLDDCIELSGSISDLAYWNRETSRIVREFGKTTTSFDRLYRRGHTYESIKKIFGEEKITPLTERLLEFKNYEKFKNIGLDEFKLLSIKEKKEFLSGYISALTPKEVAYKDQYDLNHFEILQSKMKIFKELNPETQESFIETYQNTLRKMLNEIPESEKKAINSTIDTKAYLREYRLANPIPALVDDISQILPIKEIIVNGRSIKVTQMDRETMMGVATHRMPNDEAILNIEAMEMTDPKMLLCIGQKGGSHKLNFVDSGVALIVKPRKGTDWHVQASSDIDSGNNVTKNIFNFENVMLPMMGNHCSAIDLVPNLIKKELNLSQIEYTKRLKAISNATTLQEIGKIDKELETAIRKVIAENSMYEGLIRPSIMGIAVNASKPLETISPDLLNYCERRGIPLVQIKPKS